MKNKKIFIITGRAGSGKSTALDTFEDAGFYCVDNMPVALLPIFLERYVAVNAERPGFAFVMDLREKGFLDSCKPVFTELASKKYPFEIIFLEADEKTLVRRYSQTRRQHPLASNGDLLAGVRTEKSLYAELKRDADLVVDTSAFTVHDLKSAIFEIVKKNTKLNNFRINVLSFGFKYGIPLHADMVMDVRFLPNPYFIPSLKPLDGRDSEVRSFVLDRQVTGIFMQKYLDLIDFLVPRYENEGKAYLTIAVGCTGGRHRSVAIAESLYNHIQKHERDISLSHRDIDQESQTLT
ncbi:MAG: RNase adapter RapZ [Deltaproteobacteria bacterium]|nr:RNase adapter RapZ [Deltaproteobacteria bacterium]